MNLLLKRLFDLVFSIIGAILLVVPGIIIGCAIGLTSQGPLFFRQKRIGKNGIPFTCVKFRTMTIGSETGGSITAANDLRITGIGRFLRRYKLDELPQLFNVLVGNMSFVGPRPDVPGYADCLTGDDREVLQLRPGITGPASIYFRHEEELLASVDNPKEYNDAVIWPKKVAINRMYLNNLSLFKDVGYILITVLPFLDRIFGLMSTFGEEPEFGTKK